MDGRYVSYLRVSTARQGESGLGLEAQQRGVAGFLNGGAWELLAEFVEVESGRKANRPQLQEAIRRCKLTHSTLLIAKLDRLGRNVAFLANLLESGVKFVCCDNPHATKANLQIMMVMAEFEAEAVSARTKAALGSIKARLDAGEDYVSRRSGKSIARLGNPNGLGSFRSASAGPEAVKRKADDFASQVMPVVEPMRAANLSLQAIADRLNNMHVQTARGAAWTPMAVKRILDRAPA